MVVAVNEGPPPGGAVIEELARERFGFDQLRPGQLRAVEALASGRDVLAVLPTGGGKSAIYELAGLLRAGPTVVVSPLIALQDDQLAHLRAAGLPAIVLNSQQSAGARAAALIASCDSGTFVFLSPEQLINKQTRDALQRARPGLFVVDEAHLISQWDHDFRPDYMLLGAQAEAVGAPVRLALTATAAPPVRQEIGRRLGLRDPAVVMGNLDRPHIELSVHRVRTIPDKQRELVRAAGELAGPGIVYTATHANAQAAHDALASAGEQVTLYHAGLSGRQRRDAMTAFLGGSARIVAATVAFGMGIDKPDVRWVLHADPPPSLERGEMRLSVAGPAGVTAGARGGPSASGFVDGVRQVLATSGLVLERPKGSRYPPQEPMSVRNKENLIYGTDGGACGSSRRKPSSAYSTSRSLTERLRCSARAASRSASTIGSTTVRRTQSSLSHASSAVSDKLPLLGGDVR